MTRTIIRVTRWAAVCTAWLVPALAAAQTSSPDQGPERPERPTGLPSSMNWTFNFDAAWGNFGYKNSRFNDPKENVPENFGNYWFEGYVKPKVSAQHTFESTSQLYGTVSAVGERTYGSAPQLVGSDFSSFLPEDLSIGWRSGKSMGGTENLVDVTVGRAPYQLGHGFLLYDGAAEGGSRGGYWSNARKAFAFAAIGRLKPTHHTIESFYLKKDDLPEHVTGTELWGGNYEFRPDEHTTLGVTYMKFWAKPDVSPERDHLNVFNVRAYTAPIPSARDLSFEFEYAAERNADVLDSNAWTLQGAYQLSAVPWKPKITYRYAYFEGDDPSTPRKEGFDPLLLGFSDWGTWWQGEIGGEYFLVNSNLRSSLLRAHVSPTESIGAGAMYFNFALDKPASYAPGVTDSHLAFEVDLYTDWKINRNFTASFVVAFANPGNAVAQAGGSTRNFNYGMVYLAYGY
jgi:hypothetical protein